MFERLHIVEVDENEFNPAPLLPPEYEDPDGPPDSVSRVAIAPAPKAPEWLADERAQMAAREASEMES